MTPEFILELRRHIGHARLWLIGCTVLALRDGGTGPELLIVRRTDTGAWTPVTGIVDPGEEPDRAGEREALEETGLEVRARALLSVRTVGPVTYPNGDEALYLDHCLLAEPADPGAEPHPADGENTEARWCPVDGLPPMAPRFVEFLDLALDRRAADAAGRTGPGVVFGAGRRR